MSPDTWTEVKVANDYYKAPKSEKRRHYVHSHTKIIHCNNFFNIIEVWCLEFRWTMCEVFKQWKLPTVTLGLHSCVLFALQTKENSNETGNDIIMKNNKQCKNIFVRLKSLCIC